MEVHVILTAIFFFLAVWVLPGLISYGLFRPYADTLGEKAFLNLAGFPVLFAIVGPMLYGEGTMMMAAYFIRWTIYFAVVTTILHFAERLLGLGEGA